MALSSCNFFAKNRNEPPPQRPAPANNLLSTAKKSLAKKSLEDPRNTAVPRGAAHVKKKKKKSSNWRVCWRLTTFRGPEAAELPETLVQTRAACLIPHLFRTGLVLWCRKPGTEETRDYTTRQFPRLPAMLRNICFRLSLSLCLSLFWFCIEDLWRIEINIIHRAIE